MASFLGKGFAPGNLDLTRILPGGTDITSLLPSTITSRKAQVTQALGDRNLQLGGGGDLQSCLAKCAQQRIPIAKKICEDRCRATIGSTVTKVITNECPSPPIKGITHPGCNCGAAYLASSPDQCLPGYVFMGEGSDSRCECQAWISAGRPGGVESGTTQGTLGEYQYPPELQNLMGKLYGRANEMLARKPGFSDSLIRAMFGSNFDKIRGAERATRQQTMADLASEGMLGTGAARDILGNISWQTEKNVGDIQRDIFLANEAQKREDIQGFTDAASRLMSQGMSFEQVREAINAARRGEQMTALALMLQYFNSLTSAWG
jgi:hypothetical protein